MNKIIALNQNRDFKRLYSRGKSAVGKRIVLYYRRGATQQNRLGITVSKKLGKAVTRSRVRRIIREAYRQELAAMAPGYDMVIVARGRAALAKSTDIRQELHKLLMREGLLSE